MFSMFAGALIGTLIGHGIVFYVIKKWLDKGLDVIDKEDDLN